MLVQCQGCGSRVSDTAAACPKCEVASETLLGPPAPCRECGKIYRPAYDSCSSCGARRNSEATPSALTRDTTAVIDAADSVGQHRSSEGTEQVSDQQGAIPTGEPLVPGASMPDDASKQGNQGSSLLGDLILFFSLLAALGAGYQVWNSIAKVQVGMATIPLLLAACIRAAVIKRRLSSPFDIFLGGFIGLTLGGGFFYWGLLVISGQADWPPLLLPAGFMAVFYGSVFYRLVLRK